jgi:hypothetical protein
VNQQTRSDAGSRLLGLWPHPLGLPFGLTLQAAVASSSGVQRGQMSALVGTVAPRGLCLRQAWSPSWMMPKQRNFGTNSDKDVARDWKALWPRIRVGGPGESDSLERPHKDVRAGPPRGRMPERRGRSHALGRRRRARVRIPEQPGRRRIPGQTKKQRRF